MRCDYRQFLHEALNAPTRFRIVDEQGNTLAYPAYLAGIATQFQYEPEYKETFTFSMFPNYPASGRGVAYFDGHEIVHMDIHSCECGSKDISFADNIGSDIWDGGEEVQHGQTCNVCKKQRFVTDVLIWETGKRQVHYGKWKKSVAKSAFDIF